MQEEHTVISSTDDTLKLTNNRVLYEVKGSEEAYVSMPLSQVASCTFSVRSYPVLLLLAIVVGLAAGGAFATNKGDIGWLIAFGAACIFIAWRSFRPGVLVIESSGGYKLKVSTKGMPYNQVRRFAEALAAEVVKDK